MMHTNTHKVAGKQQGWPAKKDYARGPYVSKGAGGAPGKAQTVKTVKGAKKGKP